MYSGNEVTIHHSPALPQEVSSLLNNNRTALVSVGFQEIGSSGLYRHRGCYVALDHSGKIEFYSELDRETSSSKKDFPIEICKITYRENLPVFEIQREGCKGFGIYGLTGWSHLSPSRTHPSTIREMPLREYLLSHNFLADAENPDVLRYALPSKHDRMLASSVIALFEGDKFISLLKPFDDYAAVEIKQLDVLTTDLLPNFLSQSTIEELRAEPSIHDRNRWRAWMREHTPPWDQIPDQILDEMEVVFGEVSREAQELPSLPEDALAPTERAPEKLLFLGNHRYRVPITMSDGLNISIEAKMYFSFPTDDDLGIAPFSPKATSSGFTIAGQNTQEQIRAISEINHIPLERLEKIMRPGESSLGGFLGANERLLDVLEKDNAYVLSLGLTHQDISLILRRIVALANHTAHNSITVGNTEIAILSMIGSMGTQESPFGDGSKGSSDIRIINVQSGKSLWIPEILPDLIGLYGFYEGLGTPYRVSPERIVELLDLSAS